MNSITSTARSTSIPTGFGVAPTVHSTLVSEGNNRLIENRTADSRGSASSGDGSRDATVRSNQLFILLEFAILPIQFDGGLWIAGAARHSSDGAWTKVLDGRAWQPRLACALWGRNM